VGKITYRGSFPSTAEAVSFVGGHSLLPGLQVLSRILEKKPYKIVRKVVIAVLGISVLLIGAAMILLPGPAIVVIPVGLAILATEFAWAKSILRKLKESIGWKTTSNLV
jgi:uncharacterized protein (TIGR02611 family)